MQLTRMQKYEAKKKRKTKTIRNLAVVPVLMMTVAISLSSCSLPGLDGAAAVKTVSAASNTSNFFEVRTADMATELSGIGMLTASRSSSMYFKDVSGPLSKIYVNLNDSVKAGDKLAEISSQDLEQRIQQQKLLIQKGSLRMEQLKDDVNSVKSSINSSNIEFDRLQKDAASLPDTNKTALAQAKLSLEQLKAQLSSTEKARELAVLDLKSAEVEKQELTVEKIKIKLQQIDDDINYTKVMIEKTTPLAVSDKEAQAQLAKYKTQLTSLENSKQLANVELATAVGELGQMTVDKAKLRLQQTDDAITALNKSIENATITLSKTETTNTENLSKMNEDIRKFSSKMEQLKISLNTSQKSLLLAEIDQQSNQLTLDDLQNKLKNCKLAASQNGIVTFVEKVSETDLIPANKSIIRIADPKNIVYQMTAANGRYLGNLKNATLTIGQATFNVDVYQPQPGDQLDTSTNDTKSKNRFYLGFSGNMPKSRILEETEAKLSIKKTAVKVVPKEAVREDNGKVFVDVVKGNSVESTEIIRGIEADGYVEVISGVNVGDKIALK